MGGPGPAAPGNRRRTRWGPTLILGLWLLAACAGPAGPTQPARARPPLEAPLFTDVALEAGLDFQHAAFRWGLSADPIAMMGGGLCWLDYDNDGWLDLFLANTYAQAEAGQWQQTTGLPRSALYRNEDGRFHDVSALTGADHEMRGNGCVAADLDNDGWTDLYVTTARYNLLLWNNGDGTFAEGAEAAGVDGYGWQTGAAVGDLNGDGWLDLFVAGYVDINNRREGATLGFPNSHLGLPDLLYLNQGPGPDGRAVFREVGEVAGLETADFEYGLGALLSDLDADGDLDVFVANDTNPNRLYLNEPWPGGVAADPDGLGFRLREDGGVAGVADTNSGMGVAGGDFNEDGRFDLFITNLGQQLHSVYQNRPDAAGLRFDFVDDEIGVPNIGVGLTGWGATWVDADLDGDLDLFVANGAVPIADMVTDGQVAQLYRNRTAQGQPGQFVLQSREVGLARVGPLIARGSAVADYDNDGDPDVAVVTIGGPVYLFRNNLEGGRWLGLRLAPTAPGAVVTAVLPDGRRLRRELHAGSSYLSSEDPRCLLGLGDAARVAELTIRWPDGRETRLTDVAANQLLTLSP